MSGLSLQYMEVQPTPTNLKATWKVKTKKKVVTYT